MRKTGRAQYDRKELEVVAEGKRRRAKTKRARALIPFSCRHPRRKLTCQRLRHRAKVKTALTRGYEIAYTEVAAPREGTAGFARVGDQLLMRPKPGKPLRKPCTSYVF